MLYLDDIKVEFENQGFKGTHIGISPNKDKSVLYVFMKTYICVVNRCDPICAKKRFYGTAFLSAFVKKSV